jgi:hypothetical protein
LTSVDHGMVGAQTTEINFEMGKKMEGEEEMATDSRERGQEMMTYSGEREEDEPGENILSNMEENIIKPMTVENVQSNKVVEEKTEELEEGEIIVSDQEDEDMDNKVKMEREKDLERSWRVEVDSTVMDLEKMGVTSMEREHVGKMVVNQKIKKGDAAGITLRTGKIVGCLEGELEQEKNIKKRELPEKNKTTEKEKTEEDQTESKEEKGLQVTVEKSPLRREEETGEREIEQGMSPTTEEENLQLAEENNIAEQKGEKEKPKMQESNTEESSLFQKSVAYDKSDDNSYEYIKNTSSYLSNSSLSDSSLIRNSTPNEEHVGQKRKNKDSVTGFSTKRMRAIETLANLIVTPLGQIVKDFLTRTFGQENGSAYIDNATLAHNIGGALMNGCAGYLEYQVELRNAEKRNMIFKRDYFLPNKSCSLMTNESN